MRVSIAVCSAAGNRSELLDCLADIMGRGFEFAAVQQALISELDINPTVCTGSSVPAVDALIVRASTRNISSS
jgi:hypothetical protein